MVQVIRVSPTIFRTGPTVDDGSATSAAAAGAATPGLTRSASEVMCHAMLCRASLGTFQFRR